MASSSESKSEHPIAQAIVTKADEKGIPLIDVRICRNHRSGADAMHKEQRKSVTGPHGANSNLMHKGDHNNPNEIPKEDNLKICELETEGNLVVTVIIDDHLIGVVDVADMLRGNSMEIVKIIH